MEGNSNLWDTGPTGRVLQPRIWLGFFLIVGITRGSDSWFYETRYVWDENFHDINNL